jgi:RNA recognition motif-containing protein
MENEAPVSMPPSAFEAQAMRGQGDVEGLNLDNLADPSRSSSGSGFVSQQHPNVFVRGLPLAWSEAEISAVFQQYGELTSLRLVRHSVTKQSLG